MSWSSKDEGFFFHYNEKMVNAKTTQGRSTIMSWSDKDEGFFKSAIWHISNSITNGESTNSECALTNWLKSLKNRLLKSVQPKNSTKFETSLDFEALLNSLAEKWHQYDKDMDKYRNMSRDAFTPEINKEMDELRRKYYDWIQENIHDRGLIAESELFTGEPISLSAVLATRQIRRNK